jgi:hypothetical protein
MVELYPHQKEAINNLDNGKILWGGVGSGKSLTAIGYYVEKESPKDLYIITTAKKRDTLDWESEAAKYGIGKEKDGTLHGTIFVDSWNNIGKYVGVQDSFFIFDEQRLVGSGAWTKSFIKIAKANRWILLSATPGDSWLDYIPVFIANGYFKNRTEFKRNHIIYNNYSKFPKVDRYINAGKLQKMRNELLVEMPYKWHTTRKVLTVETEYDQRLFERVWKDRWHVYADRPIKDASELYSVMRRVVNSDDSRMHEIWKLLNKHNKMIIFYNFNYELDVLRELGNEIEVAEWNGHKHDPLPTSDRWIYLVQYIAGAEGWNCTSTDATVFYSLTYSYKMFEQAKGRTDRLNTPYDVLHYYVLKSKSYIDNAVWASLMDKRDFQEPKLVDI